MRRMTTISGTKNGAIRPARREGGKSIELQNGSIAPYKCSFLCGLRAAAIKSATLTTQTHITNADFVII
jgi:hypothetical protein